VNKQMKYKFKPGDVVELFHCDNHYVAILLLLVLKQTRYSNAKAKEAYSCFVLKGSPAYPVGKIEKIYTDENWPMRKL